MVLDTRTLYSIFVAMSAVGAALVWAYGRKVPETQGAAPWAAGTLLLGVHILLMLNLLRLSPWIGATAGNAIVIAAVALLHLGACRLRGAWFPARLHVALTAAVLVAIALLFRDVSAGFKSRVVVVGAASGAQFLLLAATLRAKPDGVPSDEMQAYRLGGWFFICLGAFQLFRAATHLPFAPWGPTSLTSEELVSQLTGFVLLLTSVFIPAVIVYVNDVRIRAQLRERMTELSVALADVKTLSGLLPICASCKSVRDDRGYWERIERYLSAHSDLQLSHGLCPECIDKLYPGIMDQPDTRSRVT